MISSITTVINGFITAFITMFDLSSYGTGEGANTPAIAIATVFAIPVLIAVVRKVVGLVKSMRGN